MMISLYLCVFILVAFLSLISMINSKLDKMLYTISFFAMTLFLVLRFGQGTDYPGYMCIYEMSSMALDPNGGFLAYYRNVHTEIGWKCLMVLFRLINADFWHITVLIALFTMWCVHLGINRFCLKYKTFALVLLYPTIYLTYFFSGIRQGLVMAVFFGVLLNKLLNKNYVQYVLGVILISTFHSSSLCYLLVPIIILLSKKFLMIASILSIFVTVGMLFAPVRKLIEFAAIMIGASSDYFTASSINWFSLAERILMLAIVLVLVWQCKNDDELIKRISPFFKIYIVGFIIYVCLITNSFVSSRLAIMFKMSEIVLIPMMLEGVQKKIRNYCFIILVAISTVMTYKNINSYSEQGKYYEDIKGYNFPYVSIFNREDILAYRKEFINYSFNYKERDYIN